MESTPPDRASRALQVVLASIFLLLGGWALLFPGVVEHLALRPEHYMGTAASRLFIACFGAQAILCGTVILTCRFTASTFLVFGCVGSIPFFCFNFYFLFVNPMFTDWMWLDFVGNVGILACGIAGWRLKRREASAAPS